MFAYVYSYLFFHIFLLIYLYSYLFINECLLIFVYSCLYWLLPDYNKSILTFLLFASDKFEFFNVAFEFVPPWSCWSASSTFDTFHFQLLHVIIDLLTADFLSFFISNFIHWTFNHSSYIQLLFLHFFIDHWSLPGLQRLFPNYTPHIRPFTGNWSSCGSVQIRWRDAIFQEIDGHFTWSRPGMT